MDYKLVCEMVKFKQKMLGMGESPPDPAPPEPVPAEPGQPPVEEPPNG